MSRFPKALAACLLIWQFATAVSADSSLSILSQNMNRLFDDIDHDNGTVLSSEKYSQRIAIAVDKMIHEYRSPDIIALQEVENIGVLQTLAARIRHSGGPDYRSILLEGNDLSGIDVGYLVNVDLTIRQTRQLFQYHRLPRSKTPLFSRPPLLIEVCRHECLTLVNVHLRSMRGLGSTKKGERVASKRLSQADQLAIWIDRFQQKHPERQLLVLGDLNALQPPDRYVDVIGHVAGNPDNSGRRYKSRDRIRRDLHILTDQIAPSKRYSYIYREKKQLLDYMLANTRFAERLKSINPGPVDRRFSDHAGLLAEFSW